MGRKLFNKLKIISSPFYLVIKILSIPELFFWIIFSSIYVSLKPPLRVWLSLRMLHFFTSALFTRFALNLTLATHKFVSPSIKRVSSSAYIPVNLFSSLPIVCNVRPTCDYLLDLNETGSSFIGHLKPEFLTKISQFYDSAQYYEDIPDQYTVKQNTDSSKNTGRLFIHPYDLACCNLVREISACRLFLKLCHSYFSLPPILYQINGWTSNYINNLDPDTIFKINDWNARYPHIDFACLKFLKVFIFLDAVKDDDGPFHYWPHSSNHNCRFTSDGRYSYAEITSLFGKPYKFLSSMPGSIFIANTSNYHCDGIVSPGGFRRVLQFEYCIPGLRLPNPFEPSIPF
jgi:hypothetical protein